MDRRLQYLPYILGGIIGAYFVLFGTSQAVVGGTGIAVGLYGVLFHKVEARRWHGFHQRLGSRLSLATSELMYLFTSIGVLAFAIAFLVFKAG
jgi:hypothetical protein